MKNAIKEIGMGRKYWRLANAVRAGDAEAARGMIERGAKVEAKARNGLTALLWAAALGKADFVRMLIDAGADVNAKDCYEETALHLAGADRLQTGGKAECVRMLIDAGCDVEAKNDEGHTALHLAAVKGQADIVAMLQEHTLKAEVTEAVGGSPLLMASI